MRGSFRKKNGKIYLTVEPDEYDIDSKIVLADFARQLTGKKTRTDFSITSKSLDEADECLKMTLSAAEQDIDK